MVSSSFAKGKDLFLHMGGEMLSEAKEPTNPKINALLKEFVVVYEQSKGLPPPRSHDHRIIFKEWIQPILTRPYHYLYYQKIEIEKMVVKLLQLDVIRPSSTLF